MLPCWLFCNNVGYVNKISSITDPFLSPCAWTECEVLCVCVCGETFVLYGVYQLVRMVYSVSAHASATLCSSATANKENHIKFKMHLISCCVMPIYPIIHSAPLTPQCLYRGVNSFAVYPQRLVLLNRRDSIVCCSSPTHRWFIFIWYLSDCDKHSVNPFCWNRMLIYWFSVPVWILFYSFA